MSSSLSFSDILTIIISKNSQKSIFFLSTFASPLPKSFTNLVISSLVGSNPSALKTTFKFEESIVPDPVISKKSNAFFISFFCYSFKTYWLFNNFLLIAALFDSPYIFVFFIYFIFLFISYLLIYQITSTKFFYFFFINLRKNF